MSDEISEQDQMMLDSIDAEVVSLIAAQHVDNHA